MNDAIALIGMSFAATGCLILLCREIARAGWLPVWCDNYKRIVQERHSHRRLLTTWQWVRLCDRCDAALLGTEPEDES